MRKLPHWDYKPSPDAGLYLAGVALVMTPLLAAVGQYGLSHKEEQFRLVKDGLTYTSRGVPAWTNLIEIAAPLAAVAALILRGRISRYDVGLTLGKPAVSTFWAAAGVAVYAAMHLVPAVALMGWVRLTGREVPPELLDPAPLLTIELLGLSLWHECVLAPLREELLFRGITVPALERIGGPWLAVLGSAAVFAAAHQWVDAHPLQNVGEMAFLVVWGVAQAWIFLKTRSLAVVILLHGVSNLFMNLQRVILLCYPDYVRGLFTAN